MHCFFFSSRRRHTRCSRDWSSDVCSSDLAILNLGGKVLLLLTNEANLIVLPADAREYTPVAQYSVADSPTWAHPVVMGNRILIKDLTTLRSLVIRSEERRVGKECRSWLSA